MFTKEEGSFYEMAFPTASSLLMAVLIGKEFNARWLTMGWIIQGVLTLGLGFYLERRVLRWCGLGVLILAGLHILCVELAGMQTIYKIIAVIAMGVVFVGVSFIYARMKDKNNL